MKYIDVFVFFFEVFIDSLFDVVMELDVGVGVDVFFVELYFFRRVFLGGLNVLMFFSNVGSLGMKSVFLLFSL